MTELASRPAEPLHIFQPQASTLGIADYITFTGGRVDMADWMAPSELVFSLCSDPPEAFGRTVPEALHPGTPVIGWAHGGVSEVLAEMFPSGAVLLEPAAEQLIRVGDAERGRNRAVAVE